MNRNDEYCQCILEDWEREAEEKMFWSFRAFIVNTEMQKVPFGIIIMKIIAFIMRLRKH